MPVVDFIVWQRERVSSILLRVSKFIQFYLMKFRSAEITLIGKCALAAFLSFERIHKSEEKKTANRGFHMIMPRNHYAMPPEVLLPVSCLTTRSIGLIPHYLADHWKINNM